MINFTLDNMFSTCSWTFKKFSEKFTFLSLCGVNDWWLLFSRYAVTTLTCNDATDTMWRQRLVAFITQICRENRDLLWRQRLGEFISQICCDHRGLQWRQRLVEFISQICWDHRDLQWGHCHHACYTSEILFQNHISNFILFFINCTMYFE